MLTALTDSLSEFVQTEAAALMMGLIAVGVWCIVYGSMMLGRLNIANYNDAREQAIAESDEGKVIVNSDAAALRAMYTDEQICALLGVPEASDEEIAQLKALWQPIVEQYVDSSWIDAVNAYRAANK